MFDIFHRGKLAHCDLTANHNHHSSSHLCNLIRKDNYVYKDKAVKGVDWWRGRLTWPDQWPPVHCISFHHQQFIRLLLFLNNVQRYIGNISLFFRIWNGKWMFHSQPGNLSQSNMAFNLWLVSIHDDLLQAHRVKTSILRADTLDIQMSTVSNLWMTHIPYSFCRPHVGMLNSRGWGSGGLLGRVRKGHSYS